MILYSTRILIAKELYLSFKDLRKIHLGRNSLSDQELKKYKNFLYDTKHQELSTSNYKLMLLYILLNKSFNSFVKFLEYLNDLNKQQKTEILNKKSDIVTYKNKFKKDIETLKGITKTPENILKLYKTNKISLFYVYYFMFIKGYYDTIQSRIQKRKLKRIELFMEYFPAIQTYIKEYKEHE